MSESPSAVRRILRPIRPNPLMPTLTAISVKPPDVTDKLVSLSRLWDKDCRDCGTESLAKYAFISNWEGKTIDIEASTSQCIRITRDHSEDKQSMRTRKKTKIMRGVRECQAGKRPTF